MTHAKNLQKRTKKFSGFILSNADSYKITFIYLIAILSSGLFYSYATTSLISNGLASSFLILLLSSLVDIVVFLDVTYFKKASKIATRKLTTITIFLLIIILIFNNSNSLLFLVTLYVLCTFSFSLHLLSFEQELIRQKENVRSGLLNITLLRNFSKIIGFAIGAWIYKIQVQDYVFLLLISFLLFLVINIKPELQKHQNYIKNIEIREIKGKVYIFILSLLGTTAVFWIPLIVTELNEKNILKFSMIVFTLPGIVSVIYLNMIRNEKFDMSLSAKSKVYITIILLFGILSFVEGNLLLRILLFSFIVALGIAISVEIRSKFMSVNEHLDTKITLQTYNLINALSLLVFTLISIYFNEFPIFLLLLNIVAAITILIQRQEFNI